jgi:hypothetical protein
MPYKRKLAEEEIHCELAQDSESDCDNESEEFLGPDEEGDEGTEVPPPPGNEPGTHGEDEYEPGPSGTISTIWGTRTSKLSVLKFTGNARRVRREETPSINKDSVFQYSYTLFRCNCSTVSGANKFILQAIF